MKNVLRLLCGWMAIALAACTGDELQQIEPLQKPVAQKTISVKAYTPTEQAATRLNFEEGTEELKLSWSEGDAFTAVIGEERVIFMYDTENGEFTADVDGNFELSNGTIAYYPAYDDDEFVKDFSIQTGTLNSATTYMEGEYNGDAFSFNHSTAILKASFSGLPKNAVISSIQISGAVDITIANYNSSAAAYINLPAIPKDGQLKFMVETATKDVYTATKTVRAEKGIETGVYYNTTVELQEACLLPTGGAFYDAIRAVVGYGNATSIVFEANVADEAPATRSDSNYTIALADNLLTISTPLSEFVFNKNCNGMFSDLINIQSIDFGNCVNTANVIDMGNMFQDCSSLTSLDLSSFNTEKVIDMFFMFQDCSSLTSLDLSNFNTANVMFMNYMFNNCSSLNSLDLSSFNTANVTFMNDMFNNCSSLNSLDLSSFNTANVTYMDYMFQDCSSLTSLDLSNFNTTNVTDMYNMFDGCSKLTSLDVSSFDFSGVTDPAKFANMFTNLGADAANKPITIWVKDNATISKLNGVSTGINNSFAKYVSCEIARGERINEAIKAFPGSFSEIRFVANSSTTSESVIVGASNIYMVLKNNGVLELHTAAPKFVFNANCKDMFKQLSNIITIDFGDNIDTSNVTNMYGMFFDCSILSSLDLSGFNTSNVTNMNSMFYHCSSLTSLNLSSFDTSNVTSMYGMFYECTELSSLDLSSFNFGSDTIFTLMFDSLGVFAAIKPILVYVKNENDKNLLESKSTGINDKYAQIVVKQP